MHKIPTLFQRNHDGDRLVSNKVTPGCEWVLAGHGRSTRKFDGSCCMIRGGKLYKRHEIKSAAIVGGVMQRALPPGFELMELDPVTQKAFGWLPVGDGSEDRWHREAIVLASDCVSGALDIIEAPDGTYELLGPKVQGNPERQEQHILFPHGKHCLLDCPRDFDSLKTYLAEHDIEGIVWWHDDGRVCKLKKRDFGFKRG